MRSSLADEIAEAVLAHPAVYSLDAGPFGTVASHLPGRKVTGVRASAGEAIEVAIVAYLRQPLPALITELRAQIREVAGNLDIDIVISDVMESPEQPVTELFEEARTR